MQSLLASYARHEIISQFPVTNLYINNFYFILIAVTVLFEVDMANILDHKVVKIPAFQVHVVH